MKIVTKFLVSSDNFKPEIRNFDSSIYINTIITNVMIEYLKIYRV